MDWNFWTVFIKLLPLKYGIIVGMCRKTIRRMKRLIAGTVFFLVTMAGLAQEPIRTSNDIYVVRAEIIDGDTVWLADIDEVFIFPERKFDNRWERRRYTRLIRNVKVAYPWAKLAGQKLEEVNDIMLTMESEKERKEYMKQVEDELKDEFEDDLKKLTITQGRILIKLVDRETGSTSYELVKELRGSFSAFFWQALARLFGENLKSQYDPLGEDRLIEEIIVLIDHGQI